MNNNQSLDEIVWNVSDFVAALNQTLEFAYPSVLLQGELTNFRVSKNKWVYFDLKDELASVKFFGSVYNLPGPLEDGMLVKVRGVPRLHHLYGFSITVQSIQPAGEGSIVKAAALLEAKLTNEGLFDASRKRILPYPPATIGLITSVQAAAYSDFIKVLKSRWGGVDIQLADVQVQGEAAVSQVVNAVEYFNQHALPPDVLLIIRGGGSSEDLAAFNTEQVTRAVAASRIPTLVAIGHERDLSLAELAADVRASTPSNAAELLVPDRSAVNRELRDIRRRLHDSLQTQLRSLRDSTTQSLRDLTSAMQRLFHIETERLVAARHVLQALDPEAVLARGYAIVRLQGKIITRAKYLDRGNRATVQFRDGHKDILVQ